MLRFENPICLWLLVVIPLMALVRLWMWQVQKKRYKRLGDKQLLRQMMPAVSHYRPNVKFWLLMAAAALVIVMLARPQMGSKILHEKRNGIEIIIAIDVSNSMKAEDVVPSRLQKSKLLVENLINHFSNDKVGVVVFAGDAFVQLPITSDYVSAKMFLQAVDPSMIASQGTDIAQALSLAVNSFTQSKTGKAVVVITDGEDHEGGAVEAAQDAYKKGVNVFILGVGDPKGAPIPLGGGGYMTDLSGNTVMTALNEQMCREIAQAGKGKYIHVDNTNTAQQLLNEQLTRLQKGEVDSVIYSEYDEQFQAIGIVVLLLLILEVLILEVKNPLLKNVRIFKARKGKTKVQ
ncbi:MAG: VWA domain-containing protein [Prevotella sp.]|nr:VWA domain-containing protein [Prevotella sp.]MCD8289377.1 VWA domain-containing protein [Prevotella sp.]MCD8305615.1 VWA domain-containing protein [Prevotella sp.]